MSRLVWTSDRDFTVGGVAYRSVTWSGQGAAAANQLVVLKPRYVLERYEALLAGDRPRTVLELGIYNGGSTALLAQLAELDRLVALDHSPDPQPKLSRFIDDHRLEDVVRLHYGVDQADTSALDRIMAEDFAGGEIDLVIDDASHLEAQTRASFNRLFPHLRAGGAYIIEDWAWAHQIYPPAEPRYQGVKPMSVLVLELVLASGRNPEIVAEVVVDMQWALVRRGPAELVPGEFDLSSVLDPVGRRMAESLADARSHVPRA